MTIDHLAFFSLIVFMCVLQVDLTKVRTLYTQ